MNKTLKILLTVHFSLLTVLCFAQTFQVQAKIDSTVIFIGQQCNLTFEISQKPDIKIIMPVLKDSVTHGIEIVSSKTDTIKNKDGYITIKQNYIVTSFDSALYYIPEFPFVNNGDTVLSNSLSLKVLTVPIDTTKQEIPIADIKPIANAPIDWQFIRNFIGFTLLALLILAVGGWFLIKYLKKKNQKPVEEKIPEIIRTADEIALEKLEIIRQEKIWQSGRVKEYYTQIADVLREYIETRFNVVTFERTSSEIIDSLDFIKKDYSESLNMLKKIFYTSDMVKFAKLIPDFNTHTNILNDAVEFVVKCKN